MVRALLIFLLCLGTPAMAEDSPERMCSEGRWGPVQCIRTAHFAYDVCQQIEAEARLHRLDPHFFARLLWQESRFDRFALSTANAKGIAQFIDSTAKLRGLKDSYNPAEAIEKSAEYLSEMSRRWGNVGFAAIGYNGGEGRLERFIARSGGLAQETIDYVYIITGLRATDWREAPDASPDMRLDGATPFQQACRTMARTRKVSALRTAPPPPRHSAWGVQVTYGTSRANARQKLGRLPQACRRGGPIEYVRQPGRRGITYIAVRIGSKSRRNASRLCNQLRSNGCICAVYRN